MLNKLTYKYIWVFLWLEGISPHEVGGSNPLTSTKKHIYGCVIQLGRNHAWRLR